MNIAQLLTKLKALIYSKSETDSLLGGKANSSHTHTKSQITDFPSLATVATSGSYTDLSNKPTIPSKVSQLSNDSGFITSSGSCNYANYSGYVQGNNNSANAANALLRSGGGRGDSSPEGDTWIFLDEIGGSGAPWGFKHNQGANTIGFYGAGTETSSINLSNGHFSGTAERSNYANSAGSVAWSNVSGKPSIPSIDLRPQASADANTVSDGVSITHYGSNGPSTSLGASTDDGALFQQCWSSAWKVQIAADYRNGNLFTRGKNNGTWQPWRAVAYQGDNVSKFTNDSGYITSSGSCNYANSSGNADTLDGYHHDSFPKTFAALFTVNGLGTPGWSSIGTGEGGSCIQVKTTDNTYPSICFHRSGYSHCVLAESGGQLGTIQQGGSFNHLITSANIGSQSVNYANSAGSAGSVTGPSCINPDSGYYNEGFRFNKSINGWATITIGTARDTTSGPMNGTGWGIFCDTSDNFIINNFDSSTGNAALYCSDTNTYIPNLYISGGYKIYVG